MTINWTVAERIAGILALRGIQEGSMLEMMLREEGLKALEFTEAEMANLKINIDQTTKNITWDPALENEVTNDITLLEGSFNLIKAKLQDISKQNKLHVLLIPLAKKMLDIPELV